MLFLIKSEKQINFSHTNLYNLYHYYMGGKPTLHKHRLLTCEAKSFGSEKLKTKSEKFWKHYFVMLFLIKSEKQINL